MINLNQSQWDEILKPEFARMRKDRIEKHQDYVSRGLCTQKEANRLIIEAVKGEIEKHSCVPTLDTECPNWWD